MNLRCRLRGLSFLCLGAVLVTGNAVAQQAGNALKDQLVGTWILVSATVERQDGSKAEIFGPNPIGIVIFDADGHLSLQEMRSDLPKFASNDRQTGTTDENKAIVQGLICYFGTYTLDDAAKILTFHLEGCSFPNWAGTDVKRSITLSGNELVWTGIGSSSQPFRTIWKKAK